MVGPGKLRLVPFTAVLLLGALGGAAALIDAPDETPPETATRTVRGIPVEDSTSVPEQPDCSDLVPPLSSGGIGDFASQARGLPSPELHATTYLQGVHIASRFPYGRLLVSPRTGDAFRMAYLDQGGRARSILGYVRTQDGGWAMETTHECSISSITPTAAASPL